jgi:hypothetical protein
MNPDEANFAKLVILENAIKSIESILNHNLVGGNYFQNQLKETLEIIKCEYNHRTS